MTSSPTISLTRNGLIFGPVDCHRARKDFGVFGELFRAHTTVKAPTNSKPKPRRNQNPNMIPLPSEKKAEELEISEASSLPSKQIVAPATAFGVEEEDGKAHVAQTELEQLMEWTNEEDAEPGMSKKAKLALESHDKELKEEEEELQRECELVIDADTVPLVLLPAEMVFLIAEGFAAVHEISGLRGFESDEQSSKVTIYHEAPKEIWVERKAEAEDGAPLSPALQPLPFESPLHGRSRWSVQESKHMVETVELVKSLCGRGRELPIFKCVVYRDLRLRRMFATEAIRFGGDFLAYSANPEKHHSHSVVHAQCICQSLLGRDLTARARLAGIVKKQAVLAIVRPCLCGRPSLESSAPVAFEITYLSIRWNPMLSKVDRRLR